MRKPYFVCGGLQDNGSWCGPSATRSSNGILNSDWFRIGGGDGFYTQNDPTDWTILYSESQDGATSRVDLRAGRSTSIRPRGPRSRAARLPPATETPDPGSRGAQSAVRRRATPTGNIVPAPAPGTTFRFYWNTPFILSPHNPRTIYLGGDRLFRSYDRGTTWMASPDLTRNIGRNDRPIMGVAGTAPMASKHDGAASFSNITTISESPVVPGVIWVGTNDGNLQVSRDSGNTWKNVADKVPGVPKETHVSRVEASHFDAGTAYVTFDAHRTDDHKPYVFKTTDFGETWASVAGNLPEGNVNVIREDPKNRDLLYLGTEYAFFVSLDGGQRVEALHERPADRAHRRHPGAPARQRSHRRHPWPQHLHHGRHLGAAADAVDAATAERRGVRHPSRRRMGDGHSTCGAGGRGETLPAQNPARGSAISYWLKAEPEADVRISITDITGREIRTIVGTKRAGLNRVQWDLLPTPAGRRGGGPGLGRRGRRTRRALTSLAPGTYLVKVTAGDRTIGQKTVVVEADTTFMR